ncbi:PREDICTED: auxilin-like protein 1 isoform X2 [Ipomoea nil]|uniref:auxilin-like protein 1 isoform X2 n=1 Tax=Ipomoea nil TaxID=35883 RepID=UPI000901359E|nr:PREDICTED: auxilin-like protein 1 isoform X2 [Ipomoea nil]
MESLSRPSQRRKLPSATNGVSFSAKNAYDDVFSGQPNKRGAAPSRAVWDYAEIFGASRGSSIPVLDLSVLEDRAGGSGEDFRSSKLDYSMIFGGFDDEDIALPYEDVVSKRGKQRSSSKARTRSQGSDHSTSSETNKVFSCDPSDQSFDGKKHFNMSYHKTSQGTDDGSNGMTHIAELHAVPGFTYFIDEATQLKTAGSGPPPYVKSEAYRKRSLSGEINKRSARERDLRFSGEINKRPGREIDRHVSPKQSSGDGEPKQSSEDAVRDRDRSSWDKFHFSGNISNAHEPIPESDLSKGTKPSSSRVNDFGLPKQSKSSNVASKADGFQRAAADSSLHSSDEELDVNSDAAVSAAALKKAIQNAQESIRLAKELMERQKEGIPSRQKRSSKGSSKVGDKEHRKGHNSDSTKPKNTISNKHALEEGAAFRNGAIASHFKQSGEISTDGDFKPECHKEHIVAPESDAAEKWIFEMLNGVKHETATVTSLRVEEKNNPVAPSVVMSQRVEEKNNPVAPSLRQASEIEDVKRIDEIGDLGEGTTKGIELTEKSQNNPVAPSLVMSQPVEEKNNPVAPLPRQASEIEDVMRIDEVIDLGEGTTKGIRPAEKTPDLVVSETKINDLGRAEKLEETVSNLDSAWIVPEPGKSENLSVINKLEISKKTDNNFDDLGNLEKIHKPHRKENFEFQELENNTLFNESDKPLKNEKEKQEYFECGELPKVVEDVHHSKQINKRVRKTWDKKEIELDHRRNVLWVENEDKSQVGFIEESCESSHQVSQEGVENDERLNGVCKTEIHECREKQRLEEEHVRLLKRTEEGYKYETPDGIHKPETHELEDSEKKLDEEHVRVEESAQEVCSNEAVNCNVRETDEGTENQHIEETQGDEGIENVERASDTDERYQKINVTRYREEETRHMQSEADKSEKYQGIDVALEAANEQGAEEIQSKERATDEDEEYQERNVPLNRAEETACTQSGAHKSEKYQGIDVTLETADEQKPYPTSSACNGYSSYLFNEIREDCTSQVKESSVETNEQASSYNENEGLQGRADTFCKLEEDNMDDLKENKEPCNLREKKASDTTGDLQSALERDIHLNGRQGTDEDHFCDASKANLGFSCKKNGQEIQNERQDSETDGLTHNAMQNEREDIEKDSATNISNENVCGFKTDDVPEIQTSEEIAKSAFSGVNLGEKIIAENGKESELTSNAVNGENLRVEKSAQDKETIKENVVFFDNETDKDDVQTIHKESSTAENKKEQEPSQFPSNKSEESRVGDKEIKTEESKETSNSKKVFVAEENEIKKSGQKAVGDKDQCRKVEVGKKERERDRDRIAVERVIREARERAFADARERAERAAVERATAEVRQRVMAEAREKADKSSVGNKTSVDKASAEAKLRAERAAVERATAEARERALEKALSQKTTAEVKVLAGKLGNEKYSGTSRENALRHSFSSSDLERFDETTESAQRRKARLERHQRIMERAAKALAEKNMRDLLAQKEQAERNRLAEVLDADIKRWASGKEGNLRALLSTLQYILGPDSGWHPISLTEIITTAAVKKGYRKATLYVHPDKLQQRGASIQQKYICEKVFDLLKAAWNKFNSEER